jgi:hypothetical protein
MKSYAKSIALAAVAGIIAATSPNVAQTPSSNVTPAVAAASAGYQAFEQAALIQETLNRFDSALALHDLGQLQALGIKPASAKAWQRFFKNNPGSSVTDDCPASGLAILGDTATWSCSETATVMSRGKVLPYPLAVHFTFTKQQGIWVISDRR